MDVVFYYRDFSKRLKINADITVERYSWNMIGGPQNAYLKIAPTSDKWEMRRLLRCPVEIYANDGKLVWWGYVNRVSVPFEEQRIAVDLNEMYNHVTAKYPTTDTSFTPASDTFSIAEFGQKEEIFTVSNAKKAGANRDRDLYLADHKYAQMDFDFSGGSDDIAVECFGWFATLDWKYYSNATISNQENTAQISAIITSAGQFFNGTIIENTSGTNTNRFRDGSQTALNCIQALLKAGTSNTRPLLAYVDKNRYVHVYERDAEPAIGSEDYLMREDGRLETRVGEVVPDAHCIVAKWVRVKSVPNTTGSVLSVRPFFIESAEYNVARDKTVYYPASGYERARLEKYIKKRATGKSSGDYSSTYSGSSGYVSPGSLGLTPLDGLGAPSGPLGWILFNFDGTYTPGAGTQVPQLTAIAQNGSILTVYPGVGEDYQIAFHDSGVYAVSMTFRIELADGNPSVLSANFLGASFAPGPSDLYGAGILYDSAQGYYLYNISGWIYVHEVDSGHSPRAGLAYDCIEFTRQEGATTEWTIADSQLFIAKIG